MKNIHYLLLLFILSNSVIYGQKITIQFDSSPSTPPSVTKATLKFNKDFAYSFTLDDATIDAYTCALPLFKGGLVKGNGLTYPGLFYTDGCGNSLPFRCGLAWNSVNLGGIDIHSGNVTDQLTWKQLDTLYDFGWDVFNHSNSHRSRLNGPMSGNDYVSEIQQNQLNVQNNTQKRLEMPLFVVPSGDTFYTSIAYQQGLQMVFNQSGDVIGFGGLDVTSDYNINGKVIHRMAIEESLATTPTFLDRAATKATGGTKIWYNEFTHRIDDFSPTAAFGFKDFQAHLARAAATWGKNGSDRMWMAPLQEVYEYLLMRKFANFTTAANGSKLDLTFDLFNVPKWLRRRSVSLVVNSTVDFSNVIVPTGVKVTFKGTGNQKLINLDFTDFKTTSVFEEKTDPSVLQVFPNPTAEFLNVILPNSLEIPAQLSVYDVVGKLVLTKEITNSTIQLNTSTLPDGQYFMFVNQGKRIYQSTFIQKGFKP